MPVTVPFGQVWQNGSSQAHPVNVCVLVSLVLAWRWLTRPTLDPLELIPQNISLLCFNLIWLWDHLDTLNPMVSEMMDTLLSNPSSQPPQSETEQTFTPHIHREFPFENAQEALRCLQSGQTVGKVVLVLVQHT